MKKPKKIILDLYDLGTIKSISVDNHPVDNYRSSVTMVELEGGGGKILRNWDTLKEYLDVRVGHNYIAELSREYADLAMKWRQYEKDYAVELKEYERLKKKFS